MKNKAKFTAISLIIIAAISFVVWVVENGVANNDQSVAPDTTQQSQ